MSIDRKADGNEHQASAKPASAKDKSDTDRPPRDAPSGWGVSADATEYDRLFLRHIDPSTFIVGTPEGVREEAEDRVRRLLRSYRVLREIVARHEATIQKRWAKKTRQQRLKLLLDAWPGMPVDHRPDLVKFRRGEKTDATGLKTIRRTRRGASVAANVAQFVVYGLQSAKYLYKAYNQTSDFIRERSEVSAIIKSIRSSGDSLKAIPEVKGDRELGEILEQAKLLADEIVSRFEAVDRRASKPLGKARVAFHALRVKSDFAELLSRLGALRDQVTASLVILSSLSRGTDRGTLTDIHSVITSNREEVSKRLDKLHDDLVRARSEMRDSSEERKQSLLKTMADSAASATKHCLLRNRVEDVLQSLKFDNISDRESAVPKAHEQTFQWALAGTKSTLPDWLRSGNGIYWIEGKAGSGKSTLMKFLQRDGRTTGMLEEWASGHPLSFVSHYFWAPGTELQRNMVGLFRTLLFQILVKDPELLDRVCPARMSEEGYAHIKSWTLEELEVCFRTLSSMDSLPSRICFFIDGLDEFEGDAQILIDVIRSISDSKSRHIKFCVASRPWLRFREAFGSSSWKLSVHELTRDDIKHYNLDRFSQNEQYRKLHSENSIQADRLVQEVSDAADGVFLWVYLVVRDLLNGLSNHYDLSTLRGRLRNVPLELDGYFQRMLDSIEEVYRREAFSLFQILAYLRLPLNTFLTWSHRSVCKSDASEWTGSIFTERHNRNSWRNSETRHRSHMISMISHSAPYEAGGEKHLLIARCKDLIHASDILTHTDGRDIYTIEFLHRTVAEFIGAAMNRITTENHMILQRIPMPARTLAQLYLELLVTDSQDLMDIWNSKSSKHLNWVLYLALQAKQHSTTAYLEIIYCSFFILRGTLFSSSSYDTPAVELIGTAMAADVSFPQDCAWNGPFPWWENALFWFLHCRGCRAEYTDEDLDLNCPGICFRSSKAPLLGADGVVKFQEQSEVNLSIVESLAKHLRSCGLARLQSVWVLGLEILENSPVADIPSNIYDVCLIFIRHGAPRHVRFQRQPGELGAFHDVDAMDILGRLPPISNLPQQAQSQLVQEFANAELVSSKSVDAKDPESSSLVSSSLWSWITGKVK